MFTIRPAQLVDLDAITEIYNDAILNTRATFDTQPKTRAEQEAWFHAHDAMYPLLVGEVEGVVVGWASISRWSDRCAYAETGEASLYVAAAHRNQGLGKELTRALLAAGQAGGLHTVLVRVAEGSEASLHVAESLGFVRVGRMREVGLKFGRRLDVELLQYLYPEAGA
jgi:L-amino acid N-acyltransferase